MRNNWSKYIWKLLWFVGLVTLAYVSTGLEESVKYYGATKFNMQPLIWFYAIVPFVLGIYISLLFIEGWSLKLNVPLLLCITLPSFIVAFYGPIIYTLMANKVIDPSIFSIPSLQWMVNVTTTIIISMFAGLSLMVGLFGKKKQIDSN